ncbi:MAG: ABC transporter permease [Planctomycetes bacterium]|nr:ABC transporter permease [Planctomycetota bacterium]
MTPIHAAAEFTHRNLLGAGFTVRLLLRTLGRVHYLPRRMRFTLDQCFAAGVRALPVTLCVATVAGMILALQTGIELRRFGQQSIIGSVTALSMCREMGPFITSVILAATVGSAMAAELGTMNVSDEVTAIEVMSVDPVDYLVLPRVVGLTVMCPLLTIFSNMVGIFGGSLIGASNLGVSTQFYWRSVQESLMTPEHLLPKDVYTGIVKAVIFGLAVSVVSCSAGLRAEGGALGVGLAVQTAVKNSVILIIVLGLITTWFFYYLQIT